jgi:hypothetical protein
MRDLGSFAAADTAACRASKLASGNASWAGWSFLPSKDHLPYFRGLAVLTEVVLPRFYRRWVEGDGQGSPGDPEN